MATRRVKTDKTIIVTSADDKYAPLLSSLLNSLSQWNRPLSSAVGILDLGLSKKSLESVKGKYTHITKPGWDIPVHSELKASRPYERAKLCRPFLVDYFPGFDLYLWLDADTWIQEYGVIEAYFLAASNGALAVVPSEDRCFRYTQRSMIWRRRYLFDYFGHDALKEYEKVMHHFSGYAYYNAGVFCLSKNAPHWESWKKYFLLAAEKINGGVSDQAVLNYAIWKDNLPVYPLPATYNWLCHYSIPIWSSTSRKFHEPLIPHRKIELIHMTGDTKNFRFKIPKGNDFKEANLWFDPDR
jgi:lipopolysaccharide biosynthesis glycosyltransferase